MTINSPLANAQFLLQNGQYKQALKSAKIALSKTPKDARLHNLSGVAMCGLGQQRQAIAVFQKAIKLDPAFCDPQRNLAQTLILLDMPDKALTVLNRLVALAPIDEGAQYLRAQALSVLGRTAEAEQAVSTAITINPGLARNFGLRGVLRDRLGDAPAAIADFETALSIDPNHVDTLINISQPLARQLRPDDALAAARKAVALTPGHVPALLRLAATLVETGDTAAAAQHYHQVLKIAPHNAEAIWQLSELQDAAQNAHLLPIARAALKRAPAKSADRGVLGFAMARVSAQAGDTAAANRHLAEANRDMARLSPYDAAADQTLHQAIMDRFPLPEAAPDAEPTVTPIYVLGLPRSGTTLAEAILAAHPSVLGLGEQIAPGRYFLPQIDAGDPIGAEELAAFPAFEERLHPPLPEGCRAFVDKMPENYRLVGFLLAAHPTARIIHMRRDPRDVALSMWRAHFQGSALNYTYDLAAMAHRFNLYARMMAFWHQTFPGRILDLSYEEMTADVETTSHRLAEFCGLDWVPAMTRPHETEAAVLTLSALQLRQPVHQRSVGGWRTHAEALAPLIAGLDPALWPDLEA